MIASTGNARVRAVTALAKKAKAEGQPVMVETCPHYLLLDESYVEKYGAYAKCNPALRKKEDVERLWDYVKDGTPINPINPASIKNIVRISPSAHPKTFSTPISFVLS